METVFDRQFIRQKHRFRLVFRTGWLFCVLGVSLCVYLLTGRQRDAEPGRSLMQVEAEEFPRSLESGEEWWLLLYAGGMLYMFLALAIIVDEFFVPALMVMCSKEYLDLSDDVAGATLMAAGGSAPELFTSIIGTFNESDVGFGTIVGSAVFNVLFVIGMCAIFSLEPLKLTWWPLFRDCSYYVISLLALFLFFGPVSPNEIELWEALVLFALYFGYCLLMKFHKRLYLGIVRLRHGPNWTPDEDELATLQFANHSTFRAGIVKLMTSNRELSETAGIIAVVELKGNLENVFAELDRNGDGVIDRSELLILLHNMGSEHSDEDITQLIKEIREAGNPMSPTTPADPDSVSFEEFSNWYIKSEERILNETERTWQMFDANGDGQIDHKEMHDVLVTMSKLSGSSRHEVDETCDKVMADLDKDHDGFISKDEFFSWYKTSMFWEHAKALHEHEDEAAEPITLAYPSPDSPLRAWLFYVLTWPLVAAMLVTLPHVLREGALCGVPYRRWAFFTFLGSIAWIGLFSFLMVDFAAVIGDTLHIPSAVMGLTFLAAGTSVPDLLSSVIVAKQGKGDMAVSSSIGSNIFDITVGLPLPWLMYSLYHQKSVHVTAESLTFSVVVLIGMLVAVVLTVHLNSWVMTKALGYTMFLLYFVFVCQDLVFNFYCDKERFGSYFDGCR